MGDVVVPKLNATDDAYTLVEWVVPDAAHVAAGDVVATIETSKALADLEVTEDGYLSHGVAPGTSCAPSDVVGQLWSSPSLAAAAGAHAPARAAAAASTGPDGGPVITRPAQELMRERGLPADTVSGLGKPVIRRADVEAVLARRQDGPGDNPAEVLSDHQRAVARTVARSHASIPDAFVVMKVGAAALARRQAEIAAERRSFVGLPEQVIHAMGRLHRTFPRFYCLVGDDLSLSGSASADVGVTIDVGKGLLVPVVRDVAALDVVEIAQRLMRLRTRAMRGRITETDLAGPVITLALHMDPGVVSARPVIFPGQVCTLSLTSVQGELALSPDGTVVSREFFHVGMSFDHRIVNGRDACRYLTALREELEA